jgi:hypothetical protein
MLFIFSEQKIDILNMNPSPDLLFLMRDNFIHGHEFAVICYFRLECVLSSDIAELLKHVKYITGSLSMQNLQAKDIFGCISTALCSFVHSDLMCFIYVQLGACLPDIRTPRI